MVQGWSTSDDMRMVSHVCLVQGSACYEALFGVCLGEDLSPCPQFLALVPFGSSAGKVC